MLYVGKSMRVRTRVRAHFAPSSPSGGGPQRAETVEHHRTATELGALVLEQRLVDELRPPGNAKLKSADEWFWLRCRLDIAFPVLEVAREPAPGHAVNIGPLRGRATVAELCEQLTSLFGLRHCGRRLQLRRASVGVRADGALPVAVPRRPRPEPLPAQGRRRAGAVPPPRPAAARCWRTSTS